MTALIAKRAHGTAPATQILLYLGFCLSEGMVGPQDTYNAGPNVNDVIGPNSGTNILTTSDIRILYIFCVYIFLFSILFLDQHSCLHFISLAIV